MNRLLPLGRCERGNSVVEMALVAPILALMLIGMVDLSRAYSTKLQLTQAAQRTIEKVQSRRVALNNELLIQAEGAAAAEAAGFPDATVTVDKWLECDGARQGALIVACLPSQNYARYVSVDIADTFTPTFRKSFAGSTSAGTFTLHGEAGVRVQ